jgi:hypothetical protein
MRRVNSREKVIVDIINNLEDKIAILDLKIKLLSELIEQEEHEEED